MPDIIYPDWITVTEYNGYTYLALDEDKLRAAAEVTLKRDEWRGLEVEERMPRRFAGVVLHITLPMHYSTGRYYMHLSDFATIEGVHLDARRTDESGMTDLNCVVRKSRRLSFKGLKKDETTRRNRFESVVNSAEGKYDDWEAEGWRVLIEAISVGIKRHNEEALERLLANLRDFDDLSIDNEDVRTTRAMLDTIQNAISALVKQRTGIERTLYQHQRADVLRHYANERNAPGLHPDWRRKLVSFTQERTFEQYTQGKKKRTIF